MIRDYRYESFILESFGDRLLCQFVFLL